MTKEDILHYIIMRLGEINLSDEHRATFEYIIDRHIIDNYEEMLDIE